MLAKYQAKGVKLMSKKKKKKKKKFNPVAVPLDLKLALRIPQKRNSKGDKFDFMMDLVDYQ